MLGQGKNKKKKLKKHNQTKPKTLHPTEIQFPYCAFSNESVIFAIPDNSNLYTDETLQAGSFLKNIPVHHKTINESSFFKFS